MDNGHGGLVIDGRKITRDELIELCGLAEQAFRRTISGRKEAQFDAAVLPALTGAFRFDVSEVQRWILTRVVELGWTPERFGQIDHLLDEDHEDTRVFNTSERVGKKYQWIAYYEYLARVADNYVFIGDRWSTRISHICEGAWQLDARETDPSYLPTERSKGLPWLALPAMLWPEGSARAEWLEDEANLPGVVLQGTRQEDGSDWLVLYVHYHWKQDPKDTENPSKERRGDVWYFVNSHLVRTANMPALWSWAVQQDFDGRWMPEPYELRQVFLGEFPWAQAFSDQYEPHSGREGWRGARGGPDKQLPVSVYEMAENYTWERNHSAEESAGLVIPSDLVVREMGLTWRGEEGRYYVGDELAAVDPSAWRAGPSALLMRRDLLTDFLKIRGYDILWTVQGEKRYVGGPRLDGNGYQGTMAISGAFRLVDGEVVGNWTFRFKRPQARRVPPMAMPVV